MKMILMVMSKTQIQLKPEDTTMFLHYVEGYGCVYYNFANKYLTVTQTFIQNIQIKVYINKTKLNSSEVFQIERIFSTGDFTKKLHYFNSFKWNTLSYT